MYEGMANGQCAIPQKRVHVAFSASFILALFLKNSNLAPGGRRLQALAW